MSSVGSTLPMIVRVILSVATSVPLTDITEVRTTELLTGAVLLRTTVTTDSTRIYSQVAQHLIITRGRASSWSVDCK